MRVARTDRGVANTFTALFLTAALGFAALVIDIGNGWQERRHVINSTDAAALGAVQDYVRGDNGCALSAGQLVTANNPDATMTGCAHSAPSSGTPGRVTVDATSEVNFFFAPALGISDTTVSSSTTASYDFASTIDGGLRPFGLCADALGALSPPVVPGNGRVYRIEYGKDAQPDSCGGNDVPGNWGILDFDGGANRNTDTKYWARNGYDGPVSIGDIIEGDTGAISNSLNSELNYLRTVDHFTLPVFDVANNNGANSEFRISNFVVVRLEDFEVTGNQDDRWLEIEFLSEVVQGTGGGPSGFGAFVVGVCAVDGVDIATACS